MSPDHSAPITGAPQRTCEALASVASVLRECRGVVLLAHTNPDADALGSALALGLALHAQGKQVWVSFDHPARVPTPLSQLPGQELIVPVDGLPTAPDVVVSLDVGSSERLGVLAKLFAAAATSVVIDHHASNGGFGTLQLIDPAVPATVVLVTRLLDLMNLPITPEIAANLYAGLATDTASFRFATAESHTLAGRLILAGAEPESLLRPIMDTHPFGWLQMLSTVLGGAQLNPAAAGGAGLVSATVGLADSADLLLEELESIIDIVRTSSEAEVAVVMKETSPDCWQVSLRGKHFFNVGAVATALGGGGHPRAAGYSFQGTSDELMTQLNDALS